MGLTNRLSGNVQRNNKVRSLHIIMYKCLAVLIGTWLFNVHVCFHRNVEKELLPALRYFGLRFYVYNPVSFTCTD